MKFQDKKIAVVHDYLTQKGGAERVVIAIMKTFPNADLFTSVYEPEGTFPFFKEIKINTTFLQKIYLPSLGHRTYLPLYPLAFKNLDLKGYDLIISSSSAFAKCIKKNGSIHIAYVHTPPRFIYFKEQYLENERFSFMKKIYLHTFLNYLKNEDIKGIRSADFIIVNCRNTQERIKRIYGRDSVIIYPPIEVENFRMAKKTEDFYLIVSRLLPHKKIDVAISAFNKLRKKLLIVGSGPAYKQLKRISSSSIEFCGSVDDETLKKLYSTSSALIFPQEEDFGIVPLECMASGRPVIAFGKGGVLETVIPDETGIFFYEQTPDAIIEAVKKFEKMHFEPEKIREHARRFDLKVFQQKMINVIEEFFKPYGTSITSNE
jgi:glycosyltransferase involved in cell wall biosynthesis